jgi:peptidoglycan/xylan/chitin deacetylase (PgdA/CDA1 family)
MIGRATLKRTVKQTTGWAAVLSQMITDVPTSPRACVFYYHRIAKIGFVDVHVDDWNVTPEHFERQIATLATFAEIVPLIELRQRLNMGRMGQKPIVCLTFDDGYANFHSQVLPILKRYHVPATAFVVTSSIGSREPLPFDHWATRNAGRTQPETWRPLNWQELEDCVLSGLVTIGAHSHRHLKGSDCTDSELADEAGHSREILRSRLGEAQSVQYAYPYGNSKLGHVSPGYVSAVKDAGYALAVTTDLGLVNAENNPYILPRLEAHMMDSPGVLKAKALGALAPYRLTDHFRGAYRA